MLATGPKLSYIPLQANIEQIYSRPAYPLELVTSKIGAMKAAFENNIYESHFNRNGNKFWRCEHHTSGCKAKIVSKNNMVYPYFLDHNHVIEPVTLVPTRKLVANPPSISSTKTTEIDDTEIMPTQSKPAEVLSIVSDTDLKERLKKRFAALNRKSNKNE